MSNEILKEVTILYEDADCAVVNKPAGLMVHSDAKNTGPFLTDWILEKFPEARGVGESITTKDGEEMSRDGIVHRLDRETSGAIIVAKTDAGFDSLKKQFQDRSVKKKYLAFVWGELKEEFGTIDRPIARSGSDFRKWSAGRGRRGEEREAQTYWTRMWTGVSMVEASKSENVEKFSLIEAEPQTGRTHQIRVHFLAIQHPVVSDSLYAESKPKALGFERLALHSWAIEFTNTSGTHIQITAPLPEDFASAFKNLGIALP